MRGFPHPDRATRIDSLPTNTGFPGRRPPNGAVGLTSAPAPCPGVRTIFDKKQAAAPWSEKAGGRNRMFGQDHRESPARLARVEALACRDVLTPAPPRPRLPARARLAFLARRLGHAMPTAAFSRAASATDVALTK
jgi:hypothetical protein